jgi:hypothetical protein
VRKKGQIPENPYPAVRSVFLQLQRFHRTSDAIGARAGAEIN